MDFTFSPKSANEKGKEIEKSKDWRVRSASMKRCLIPGKDSIPPIRAKLTVTLANPSALYRGQRLPKLGKEGFGVEKPPFLSAAPQQSEICAKFSP